AVVDVATEELVPVTDKDLESNAVTLRWRSVYNVSLDLAETEPRFETFKEDARYVNEFNKRDDLTYKVGLNQFSDWADEELDNGIYIGALPEDTGSIGRKVPAKWDWRNHRAVTPVKNQGHCSAYRGINAIKTEKLRILSEQEVLDCSGGGSCEGGHTYKTFDHAIKPGLALDHHGHPPYYPAYVAKKKNCRFNPLRWRVYKQPVSVVVEANHAFKGYRKGVFLGPCGTRLNHAVVVVGYGTTKEGIDYSIVKNSWGKNWGENGYIRMKRHVGTKADLCGIYIKLMYPIKKQVIGRLG
ncbi:hypothetical protein SORBI_3002G397001, partial [Sorghum bicolor]